MMYGGGGLGGGMGMGMGPGAIRRAMESLDDEYQGKAFDGRTVGRLVKYMAPYKVKAVGAIVAMLVVSLTNLAGPYLVKVAIDGYISRSDLGGLNLLAALFILNSIAQWLAQYYEVWTMSYVGQTVLHVIRAQMLDRLQTLSISFFDRNEMGRVMSRVQNDVFVLQDLVTTGTLNLVSDAITLVGICVVLLSMNVRLALATLVVIPIMTVIMARWQQLSRDSFRKVRSAISVVNASIHENVSGVRVTQSLSREHFNLRKFGDINEAHLDANLEAGKISAVVLPVVEIVSAVGTALVIIYGGFMVLNGELALGSLVAFTLYISRFFEPIRDLSVRYTQLQRAMAGGERVFEVLDTEPAIKDADDAVELGIVRGEVEFDHVDFSYVEGAKVLDDVCIRVRPGETVAIVGPTGAGKSTIISLINRFYDVSNGAVKLDGIDLRQTKQASLHKQIGIVLQDPFLFSGTIKENIRCGRLDATDEEIAEVANALGLHDFVIQLEKGYDTRIHERGINLSVGQRQLISFARALIADPRILILDEATASIDTQTEQVVQAALRRLLKGRTSFIIAHRLATIKNADRIVVLERGRIVEEGSHEELLAKRGVYYVLYSAAGKTVRRSYEHNLHEESKAALHI
ncbi:MAG: ABC transporter ATP-binding protein [Chloroflexota bacterium]|nr:MAG: ABC transporter ATP-binding protein [Chloroflexota bacterium]